jgi:hypothetical protein
MSEIYGAGVVMGMAPSEVDRTSVWKFLAAAEGFARANDPDAGKSLSASEADELWNWMQTKH